jgi:glycosyltransferase involved in cell wall biosynthesis
MPFVSFCFTTFKRGSILKDTLDSIKRQAFDDYEVIVSDNDPENSAREFVESMNDTRFRYFSNGANLGMKPSFNKSLQRSSGDFIVMIADDDPIYHDMLQTLVGLANKYPGYGMYMGGSDWLCTTPEVAKLYKLKVGTNSHLSSDHEIGYINKYSGSEFLIDFFTFKIFPSYLWSTCMVKRDIIIQMGGIPDYGTPFLGDYAYLSLMGSVSGCVVINKSLGCQTVHNQNFGRNQNDQIITAAKAFPKYLHARLSHLQNWHMIEKYILDFTGSWVISHMAFLHHYFNENEENEKGLAQAERDVFKIDYVRKFHTKYFFKKRFPKIHDQLVILKKKFKG